MKTARFFRTITAMVILLVLIPLSHPVAAAPASPVPVFSICGIIPRDAGTPTAEATPSMGMAMPSGSTIEFDLLFIDLMIPHHQSAVVMAQVALERADHPEILELAQNIIATQSEEIVQLQEWRDAWYPDAAELPMNDLTSMMQGYIGGMMDMNGSSNGQMAGMDLSSAFISMCNAPEPFELAFLTAMIPHHQSAIDMANAGLENTIHPELKALQIQIITAQQTEIDQMKSWLSTWFTPATPIAN